MLNKIITIYAMIDDLLRAIGDKEDCRRNMTDAEVITTAVVASLVDFLNQFMQSLIKVSYSNYKHLSLLLLSNKHLSS